MSNLTDLLPAGAGGKQVSFVASGTIGNGVTVALNSDGTVTAVASDGSPQVIGTPVTFYSEGGSGPRWGEATYDSVNNKVIFAFRDESGTNDSYGVAVVGTVSGATISFGTPVIFSTGSTFAVSCAFDSNEGKVVIAYRNASNSSYGTAIVGTVSGTSISFGSAVVFDSSTVTASSTVYDSTNQKIVICYWSQGATQTRVVVGTVSGSAISFGSASTITTSINASELGGVSFDSSANKIVVAYTNASASDAGTAVVGTVTGTSVSFGTPVVFVSSGSQIGTPIYDSTNNKTVLAYRDHNNSLYGTAIVGTVSGTSISFGTPVVFNTGNTFYIATVFDAANSQTVIEYTDGGNSNYGTIVSGSVSGTSISFSTPAVFESATTLYSFATFDSDARKAVIGYTSSSIGKAFLFSPEASNSTDFIGISDSAISDTASGSVTIKGGISTNVTGLTANSTYYVQANGTLSTTASDVLAGKALSSTSINLDYTT
ncbi:MAG: hypothetical protein CMA72_04830 [Euryarchaeota archaeon]|nr:hypothetical protein [Euryarchaeota archaeon]|tara:strand:+ start:1185 stop:2645 length:1461 start_codon:yes stop_codon:yes gene_type:complete